MGTTKPTTSSSTTSANTNKSTGNTAPNLADLIAAAGSITGGVSGGAVFTKAEGNAVVQNVFQQILGRNATGNDYAKAMSLVMNQAQDTSSTGRAQAVMEFAQNLPEYQAREENKYLDAIYNAVAADVRKVRQ